MNEFWEENKKMIIIIGAIFALVILFTVINFFTNKTGTTVDPKESVKTLAETYYQELYYPYMKDNYSEYYEAVLETYADEGLKVSLMDIITAIGNIDNDSLTDKKGNSIDISSTYVTFYPSYPYAEEDYRVELDVAYYKGFASEDGENNE